MSQDDVQKIKERLGIKEVIESYVKIEKAGKNYKARCPFHNEKTPSLFIFPETESYYCFGCGAKGDIFSFTEQFENIDFAGALKNLAEKAGVKITNYSKQIDSKYKKMYEILEESTKFFEKKLDDDKEAQKYLEMRGLKLETIKEWRIGLAPEGWKNLYDYLKEKGYTEAELDSVGLIKKGEKGEYYDRFRSRIMFPIRDLGGKVVAYSGRIFGKEDETAKYINSPETLIFKKSEILYGFDLAKNIIRKNNFSILVEGQMDTIMCHQAGYKNTIASSGTSLTEGQLKNISRLSKRMVIAYDSDNAGFRASERAWGMALSMGMDVKIAPIPKGQDPADVVKENLSKWREIIKDSKHIIDVLIKKVKLEITDKRSIAITVSAKIIPYLAEIKSDIEKSVFVKKVSEEFQIPEDAIYNEIKSYKKDEKPQKSQEIQAKTPARKKDEMTIEKRLFGIIFWQESSTEPETDTLKLKDKIKNIIGEKLYETVFQSIKSEIEEVSYVLQSTFQDKKHLEKETEELLRNLKIKYLGKKREYLLLSLKKVEGQDDEEEEDKLLKQIGEISKEIQKLNQ